MSQPESVLATIAGITPGSRAESLWHSRPIIVEETNNTFRAMFESEASDLTQLERESAALWSATLAKSGECAAFHRQRLRELGDDRLLQLGTSPDELDLTSRESAILRHVELLTVRPSTATKKDTDALLNAGLTAKAIVELAHLVAFLAFEIRAIAMLRALAEGDL